MAEGVGKGSLWGTKFSKGRSLATEASTACGFVSCSNGTERSWRSLMRGEEAGARAAELGGVLGRGLGAVGGDRQRRRLGSDALRGLRLTARGPSRSRGGARVPGGGEQWLSKRRRDYSVRRRGETSPVSVGQVALKR